MEGASATRLRFKGSSSSSSRTRKSESGSSGTYSPSESSSHHKHRHPASIRSHSRSRSRSPRRSSHRPHKHHSSKHHSRKHHRSSTPSPPHRTAPATYSDYFDNDTHEANESRFREEQETHSLDEQQDQDPWLAHLFDELSNDDPLEYHSSRFESLYHSSVRGSGAGHSSKYDHLNSLSDDNYANYMRQGMSSRSNHRNTAAQKEEQEWAEWVQDQERIKYRQERDKQREKDERARQRRQERKDRERGDATSKVSMDSAMNVLRKKTLVDKARMEYDEGWVALMDRKVPVSEDTIPWPPSTTASGSGTPTITTSTTTQSMEVSLYEFLFLGTPAEKTDIRRQLLRREQLKFHPDKFKQRFGTRLPMNAITRQAILDRVEGVAQELNEIGELLLS
ncbi:hypothetical protein CPB97_007555 [Podila verticillata]|nr:hypothetical protein CPB97_007555 [Podila verticillata]